MAPVILHMDVHCACCARKIRKAINNMLGVDRVWASPDTGLVVVAGTADALALRSRLRQKMRKPVTILSDGMSERRGGAASPWAPGMVHLAPPPQPTYAAPPPGYPPYYGRGATAPLPAAPYEATPAAYPYGNHWASSTHSARQYAPSGTPARFVDDDDEAPGTCCSVQ